MQIDIGPPRLIVGAFLAVFLGIFAATLGAWESPTQVAPAAATPAQGQGAPVPDVHPAWIIPFILLLGCIATGPLCYPKYWEHGYPCIAIGLAAIVGVYYLAILKDPGAPAAWLGEMRQYISFIALLGSLFIVSGGIVIHITRKATAGANTLLLLTGAIIANLLGTTGAAMLLIRPYLRMNRGHIKPYHVIFFIFIIANCGGALTPLGDPPLFMGYLKGVPFLWVLQACWPMWAACVGVLLVIFFVIDSVDHAKMEREHQHGRDAGPAVEIFGFPNFLFIGLILVGVFQPSIFDLIHAGNYTRLPLAREVLMVIAAIASLLTTKPHIYERNRFTLGPIREVAILFLGIFSTMVPALNYLDRHAEEIPLRTPGQYYFSSGLLSAVLDNAPTYLVFLETRQGQVQGDYGQKIESMREMLDDHPKGRVPPPPPVETDPRIRGAYDALLRYNRPAVERGDVTDADIRIAMMISSPDLALYLIAISLGSVFFGACTYIGNGPNFMVKSIAESAGVKMPGFVSYVVMYTLPILVPVYILVWVFFLRGALFIGTSSSIAPQTLLY